MRFRPQNTLWLAALAALTASAAVLTGPTAAVAALIALLLVAMAASLIEFQPRQLRNSIPVSPLAARRMSPQAREAAERARRRSTFTAPGLTLLDVGLISLQSSFDGMVMRRSRSISLDDKGVRPYITIHVMPDQAERNAIIRFEIVDHNGDTQYIHEMKTYLRDGEMNILADHQLPLSGNERLAGAGDWDLRVSVDGSLMGMFSFTATPSIAARSRQFEQEAERARYRLEDDAGDSSPVSLDELLRTDQKNRDEGQLR
jgi:hypothetical protein